MIAKIWEITYSVSTYLHSNSNFQEMVTGRISYSKIVLATHSLPFRLYL